jgi:hypothetical protein
VPGSSAGSDATSCEPLQSTCAPTSVVPPIDTMGDLPKLAPLTNGTH